MDSSHIHIRKARLTDLQTYFKWTNDPEVRANSYNSSSVSLEKHTTWFTAKLNDPSCFLYFFTSDKNEPVGQVRIEKKEFENIIGISIDSAFRGKKLSSVLLIMACEAYFALHPGDEITAYIKEDNISSFKAFAQAQFSLKELRPVNEMNSFVMIRKKSAQ